ncbi:MAG: hypothetical protein J1E61_08270 [Lachnospiraceae bacterium]|nr:hypothetical protein [Lachnospiraceae bacterium]
MDKKGKERLMWEIEKFVITRLRSFHLLPYRHNKDYLYVRDYYRNCYRDYYYSYKLSAEERLKLMDKWWNKYNDGYRKSRGELVEFSQLTNHEICHEMFWNAFRDHSKMYIQIKNLNFDEETFSRRSDEMEVITLQCSLLTLQMLDYDIMMFRAMSDEEDEEYREEAKKFYRPYLFSYVAEINRDQYERLGELQRKTERNFPVEEDGPSPHLWLACTFNTDIEVPSIGLEGYVVQSASSINKIRANLYIIENDKVPIATIKSILDEYELSNHCLKDDNSFTDAIKKKLGNDRLSTIDVYKVGNGNCVYAQGVDSNVGFFYDIGFNYRHRPQKIAPGVNYSYSNTMKKVYTKKPSFFILSHWDMDHIAGSAAARKDFFEKDWFAPDCYDACIDAQRLAKYLDMKQHLYLAKRPPRKGKCPGRLIGQIDIKSSTIPSTILATYRLYMGKKVPCDRSYPNCEGIVIEYTDQINEKVVLMMGDVNYASFNEARLSNGDKEFADTKIDYLIAPHHGSEHTDYIKIAGINGNTKEDIMAIICCTNEENENRPNKGHRDELEKRFGKNVITTEEALLNYNSIRICLYP